MGGLIQRFVGDGAQWDLTIDYWHGTHRWARSVPLLQHRDSLPDDVLLLNGDLLCGIDFAELVRVPRRQGGLTMAGSTRRIDVEFGCSKSTAQTQRVPEKPQLAYLANMGIYVLSRTVLDQLDGDGAHGWTSSSARSSPQGCTPTSTSSTATGSTSVDPGTHDRANLEFAELRRQLLGDEAAESDSTIDLRPLRPDPHPDPVPVDAIVGSVA